MKFTKSFFVIMAVFAVINFSVIYAAEWTDINGKVANEDGTSLCAMVLANGQHMFSCDPIGNYTLHVPLDTNGQITLFAFCDGFMPFKTVLSKSQNKFDISMSPCESPNSETCGSIKGNWSAYTTGNMTMTISGKTSTSSISGNRTVSVTQTGCYTEWNFSDTGYTYKRAGNIEGNTVHVTGECTTSAGLSNIIEDGLEAEGLYGAKVTITSNTHTGEGTISGNTINYKGSGNVSGSVTYQSVSIAFSVLLTENSTMTKSSISRSKVSEESMEIFSPIKSAADLAIEAIKREISY